MKKYKLFDEFCGKELYGEDLADAILHAGALPRQKRVVVPGTLEEVPPLVISSILGYEDTSQSTRGAHKFERVVVETNEGTRIGIDAYQAGELL